MLSIILDNDSPEFDPYYSDLNFDEQINIFDLRSLWFVGMDDVIRLSY